MKSILDTIGFNTILRSERWNHITELAGDVEVAPVVNQVFYGATYLSPDTYFFTQHHSLAAWTWASMEWVLSDEVDTIVYEVRTTVDIGKQSETEKALQRKLVDDQVGVFLLTQASQQAFHNCLQGFVLVPMHSFE